MVLIMDNNLNLNPNPTPGSNPSNNFNSASNGNKLHISIISVITILFILAAICGFLIFSTQRSNANTEIVIGMILVLGVSVLLLLLFLIAVGFNALNLSDPGEALGLPQGSIRALIALLLILVWVIVSIFLFTGIIPLDSIKNADAVKLGQQFYTTMSTLVVAISAFYFGSNSIRSGQNKQAPNASQGQQGNQQQGNQQAGQQQGNQQQGNP
jgi:hypothetical protein